MGSREKGADLERVAKGPVCYLLAHHLRDLPCPALPRKKSSTRLLVSLPCRQILFISVPQLRIGTQKFNVYLLNCIKFTEIFPVGNEKGADGDGRPEKQL